MNITDKTSNTQIDKELVSVIIPTFNRAKMLKKAVDSALAQTANVEVIIVNHGSTDNTDEVVASYGGSVRYIKRTEDFGPHFCFHMSLSQLINIFWFFCEWFNSQLFICFVCIT